MIDVETLADTVTALGSDVADARSELQSLEARRRELLLPAYQLDQDAEAELRDIKRRKREVGQRLADLETALRDATAQQENAETERRRKEHETQRLGIADTIDRARPLIEIYAAAVAEVEVLAEGLVEAMTALEEAGDELTEATGYGHGGLKSSAVRARCRTWLSQALGLAQSPFETGAGPTPLTDLEEHYVGDHIVVIERSVNDDLKALDGIGRAAEPAPLRTPQPAVVETPRPGRSMRPADQPGGPTAYFGKGAPR